MAIVERRTEPRYKIRVDVVTRDAISMEAIATDISSSGLRIQAAQSISPETQVVIFMPLKEEVIFRGKVLWVHDYQTQGRSIYQMGIQVNVIALPDAKAFELSEREELLEEILAWIKKK